MEIEIVCTETQYIYKYEYTHNKHTTSNECSIIYCLRAREFGDNIHF